jgi:hypothetical protein
MNIHTGHPESYIPLQDKIALLIVDYELKDIAIEEIERIKT